ncbi:hypothetical protein C0584_04145 [Candidatus Parcubacteria bacterium]|nr:MAG: hypothetical protein C0584_04145 [Candidatus Parcubacteria bacterium]
MTFKESAIKSIDNLKGSIPIMFGIIFLVSMISVYTDGNYDSFFIGNPLLDPLIGAISGSISFGIPITSYIVGGELLSEGVSLLAVTAFILSWSTVGVAILPLEAKYFGFKFSAYRNTLNFIFSILVAIFTVYTVDLLKIWF